MNKKTLLIGFGTFCAGITTGYFMGIARTKAQYKADVAEVKDFYAAKLEEMGVQDSGFEPDENQIAHQNPDDEPFEDEMSEEYFNKIAGYSTAATGATGDGGKGRRVINYNKPSLEVVARELHLDEEPEPDDEEEIDEFYDEAYEAELDARAEELAIRRTENQSKGLPYTINEAEYDDAPENYTRQDLYYYSSDRVLCEDDDSIVEEEEALIGFDYEDVLDMQTTAWVRNDAIMNVYQIHRIDQSYSETVANVMETPRERDFRIIGRRKEVLDR